MKKFKFFSLLAAMVLPVISFSAVADSEHQDQSVLLSAKQMQLANIKVVPVKARSMDQRLYAPGEIQANGYTSYVVSSRVESVIVQRHAILGEHVEQGQALVTLFSETVADAQASYRIAYADWQRAKTVGNSVISESELLTAKTRYISAHSRLKAYGLDEKSIALIANEQSSSLGEYTLKAARSGVVLADDFQQGQRVSAGDRIMVLTDERALWVEARLAANNPVPLPKGTSAQVILTTSTNEMASYQAVVIQQSHTIDPKTRTRIVRLLVNNDDHQLHPGLFVDVYFALATPKPVLVVPETALIRSIDGDWLVYVQANEQHHEKQAAGHEVNDANQDNNNHEQKTRFVAQEVELGTLYRTYSQETKQWQSWREISDISENNNIAMTGAFFIASQSAKRNFDPHNH